jgi:hypothetical protein
VTDAMDWVVLLFLGATFGAILVATDAVVTKDAPWLNELWQRGTRK